MHKRDLSLGSQTLSIETGRLAKQADGSVVVRMGDTMVLVTACHSSSPREGIDFLPLTVDYREYTYASGRIPGGFFKREGKATEKETLTSRVIDRPIRPLFPAGWALRDAGHRVRAVGRHRERLGRARADRRRRGAGAVGDAGRKDRRRRARRPGRRPVHRQPDLPAAQAEQARPGRRRHQGRHRDGRSGRQRGDRRRSRHRARDRARRDQAARRHDRRARQGSRPHQAGRSRR